MATTASGRAVRVHVVSAAGEEAEFNFAGARFALEGGALLVFAQAGEDESNLMAFAPGAWRAAWHVDDAGKPVGLSTPDKAAVAGVPERKAPAAEPDGARSERAKKLFDLLRGHPYEGLDAFAALAGESPAEVERILSAALGSKAIDADAVAVPAMQRELDAVLPEFFATASPRSLQPIMAMLKEREPTHACDLVQLRVWIKRNPPKRPAEPASAAS